MKEYQKPEVLIISLQSQEAITDDELLEGSQGVEDAGDLFG